MSWSINMIIHYFLYFDFLFYLLLFWYLFGDEQTKFERQQPEIDRLRIERAHYDALLRQHGDKLDEAFRKTLEATLHAAGRRYVEGRYRGIRVWRWSRSMTVARNYLMVLNYSIDDLKERLLRYYPEGPPPPRYYAGWGGDE
ncbi:hypothetical protein MAPG_09528 [Magnaporthiopsis poae ATCC 64411]|uniref:Uncharacterized protein n=1 Tax=Magnaporthiopsis poae (strain ATCC 64411 / 73-15) TaxID=644358 RepID=A0A0C4EA69_MAGP6|nr:hypothetical protein MAPG_09528 [Magnaporthiopsis poae ATCC 64411]